MCWGIRRAVASAYIAPAECAKMENLVIRRAWQIAYTSSVLVVSASEQAIHVTRNEEKGVDR